MLFELYQPVLHELARLRGERRGLPGETCRGQCLRARDNNQALSFHCFEPQCDRKHGEDCYRKYGKNKTVVEEHFREQVAVSELCQSFEGVTIVPRLRGALPTLRRLEEYWDISGSREDQASFEALFDETAQLLALLHMEAHDRERRDGVDIHNLYGLSIAKFLENAMMELWRAHLYGIHGKPEDKAYNNIASHLRILAEELVSEGLHRLKDAAEQSDPQIMCKDVKSFPDKVLEIARLQSELSSRGQLEITAFQEPCQIVQQFASSSGSHAPIGHEHFELAGNLGNNYIIICRAIVHACALYSKFAVDCSTVRHLLYPESLPSQTMQDFSRAYLPSLKTKVLREIPYIFDRCKSMRKLVPDCIVLQEEFEEVHHWCDQLAQGLQERLKQRAIKNKDDFKLADNLRKLVQDAHDLVEKYALMTSHGQLIHAVFDSKMDLKTLRDLCHGLRDFAGQLQHVELADYLGRSWLYEQEDEGIIQGVPFAGELLLLVSPRLSFDVMTVRSAFRRIATGSQVDRLKNHIKATLRPGPQLKIGHLDMRVLWLGIKRDTTYPLSARSPEQVSWKQFRGAFPDGLPIDEETKDQVVEYLDYEAPWHVFQASVRRAALKRLNQLEQVHLTKFNKEMPLYVGEVDCSFEKTKDVLSALKSCVEED
ncbi:hypothetical protein DUNSADRAFT_16992 [Dunaliella salina]|uniref:Uncharacterized protein n=1 Tax=Dunaliella salina TaxID=3046 RepID=A0ABQ7G2K7_DUNSA|nr:hypothetical protein DUNSADRAFT_16992 [Dunaliella salina]|eukprot:KAF5828842.1 hypothetical protein DUNSADRAFT_16992 [Dunaliella salina]